MVPTCQDSETVLRFQQGDVDAFDELARKYSPNWLFQIAKRNCINIRRKDKVSPDQLLPIEEFIPTEDERQTLQIADWRTTPVQETLNRELGKQIGGDIPDS